MNPTEQDLVEVYRRLAPAEQATLLAFARFLAQQAGAPSEPAAAQEPLVIARPPQETVVGALKRLTATYPMLDKAKLLNETSGLVAQHVMQGRNLVEVINELEAVFSKAYAHYRTTRESS